MDSWYICGYILSISRQEGCFSALFGYAHVVLSSNCFKLYVPDCLEMKTSTYLRGVLGSLRHCWFYLLKWRVWMDSAQGKGDNRKVRLTGSSTVQCL